MTVAAAPVAMPATNPHRIHAWLPLALRLSTQRMALDADLSGL